MLNLALFLETGARSHPDRDALVLGDVRLSYAQVDGLANQVANLLVSRGIGRGDKVALSCPNLPYFPIVYFGILKAGASVVPLNVLLRGREIAYHLDDCDAKAYFCFEGTPQLPMGRTGLEGFGQAERCEHFFVITAKAADPSPLEGTETLTQALAEQSRTFESVATDPGDTAVILYTSGTTGQPKGAELTHSNMVMNALAVNRWFESTSQRPDRFLVVLPLFHSFGQTVAMNAGFSTASTLVLLPRFEPTQALQLMQREEITFFSGVPTMYWALLDAVTDEVDVALIARNLRVALSGGSALPVEILKRFRERFGVEVLEGYGLSETSPVATCDPFGGESRPGSIGLPLWSVDVQLVDSEWKTIEAVGEVGEIAIRGHNVMKGYYQRPEATAEVMHDGWFRSGDLARRDEDGYFYIVDRAKDMIIRGGYNVYPREIEEGLMTHPAVSLAAVGGVPHEVHGEEVKAYVIVREGSAITEDELRAWSKEQLAGYKYPRVVQFAPELPMTATGKILKRELTAPTSSPWQD